MNGRSLKPLKVSQFAQCAQLCSGVHLCIHVEAFFGYLCLRNKAFGVCIFSPTSVHTNSSMLPCRMCVLYLEVKVVYHLLAPRWSRPRVILS